MFWRHCILEGRGQRQIQGRTQVYIYSVRYKVAHRYISIHTHTDVMPRCPFCWRHGDCGAMQMSGAKGNRPAIEVAHICDSFARLSAPQRSSEHASASTLGVCHDTQTLTGQYLGEAKSSAAAGQKRKQIKMMICQGSLPETSPVVCGIAQP